MRKKAQGGASAAILIAVIAGFIMLYIIFLPEAEREALLENKTIDDVRRDSGKDRDDYILLREFPGRIDEVDDIEDAHIPNVLLFETTNAREIERINPFIVRNGWFDEKAKVATFELLDVDNTDNVLLSFTAPERKGTLMIKLNGEMIFEQALTRANVEPIQLKKSLLDLDNELEFSVSSVGIAFWSANEYTLENVKIIGDVTDKSKQEARNVFTVTSKELSNIDEAFLRFVPYCDHVANVGRLDISINSRNVFSAVPVCEDAYKQPIPIALLNEGENRILFKTSRGSYSVEQVKIEFDEDDTQKKVWFFELNQTEFEDIVEDRENVQLIIEFVDDDDKQADINVNDRFITLDDPDKVFTRNLDEFVREGNNFIELEPRSRLDIVEIRVELDNAD